jgi:hypothetical protein
LLESFNLLAQVSDFNPLSVAVDFADLAPQIHQRPFDSVEPKVDIPTV